MKCLSFFINKYKELPLKITKGEDRVALFFAQKVLEAFEPEVRSIAIPHYLQNFSSGHFFVSYTCIWIIN